jgi:hypothetical protein
MVRCPLGRRLDRSFRTFAFAASFPVTPGINPVRSDPSRNHSRARSRRADRRRSRGPGMGTAGPEHWKPNFEHHKKSGERLGRAARDAHPQWPTLGGRADNTASGGRVIDICPRDEQESFVGVKVTLGRRGVLIPPPSVGHGAPSPLAYTPQQGRGGTGGNGVNGVPSSSAVSATSTGSAIDRRWSAAPKALISQEPIVAQTQSRFSQ